MATTAKLHGKRGLLTWDGGSMAFKVVSGTGSADMADGTDSDNYDAASDTLFNQEEEGKTTMELKIEYNHKLGFTKENFLATLLNGGITKRAVVKEKTGVTLLDGDFKMSGIDFTVSVTDVINGTGTLRSYGQFWFGDRA
jgi:hypothetical protein